MNPEQQAAYVISQSACAIIEALSIIANNTSHDSYAKTEIISLIEKYGIHHNAVIGLFQSGIGLTK